MEARLYDVSVFGNELLKNLRPSSIRSLVKLYLREGAHPFFLRQAIRLVASKRPAEYERIVKTAEEALLDYRRPKEVAPARREKGLLGAISRIFDEGGDPRDIKDVGIVHGVVVEMFADVVDSGDKSLAVVSDLIADWDASANLVVDRVLSLPYADFALYDTVHYVLFAIEELLKGRKPTSPDRVDQLRKIMKSDQANFAEPLEAFFPKRIGQLGIPGAVVELAATIWSTTTPSIFWGAISVLAKFCFKQDPSKLPFTQVIETLLNLKQPLYAAGQILNGYPAYEATTERFSPWDRLLASAGLTMLAQGIKDELPNLKTRYAIIRWLKRASHKTNLNLLIKLAFGKNQKGVSTIDDKAETLIEDVFGPTAWTSICDFQDPSLWASNFEVVPGLPYREGIDTSSPQYIALENAVHQTPLAKHDPDIAEKFESIVLEEGITEEVARKLVEQHLNLLSGDLVVTVSHVTDEWRQLRRKAREFLGAAIPRVDFAKHKKYGDRGAACRFRVFLPDLPNRPLNGILDPEGELTLDNTPILDSVSQLAVKAVVTQTLCAALIPSLVDALPSSGNTGFEVVITGEPEVRRPTIHMLGEIGAEDDKDESPSRGMRLNPMIAMFVFRWLLGQFPEYECRLHFRTEERVGNGTDVFYKSAPGARDALMKKKLKLSQVYIRAVRAHTKPLHAYLDETNTVRTKQMSSRAKRNYDRYRQDGGRELNFAPIQKTYIILPSEVRVPIRVERTFNQGCFVSLEDAIRLIFDSSFKADILQKFVL